MARWTLVSKSPTPIFGERRTSLKVTERCLRLASFSRFVSSYLYWPKSRNLTTGGDASRGNLHEVQAAFLRHLERPWRGHHTQLGILFIDHPDLRDPDHLIHTQVSADGSPLVHYGSIVQIGPTRALTRPFRAEGGG